MIGRDGNTLTEEEFVREHLPSYFRYDTPHGRDVAFTELMKEAVAWAKLGYVSCWHTNDGESAALWGLYLKSGEGVAIRSTLGKLQSTLDKSTKIYEIRNVEYRQMRNVRNITCNIYDILSRKRKSFEHEREVRAITIDVQSNASIHPASLHFQASSGPLELATIGSPGQTNCDTKIRIDLIDDMHTKSVHNIQERVEIADLIDVIRVAPRMPSFFLKAVEAIVKNWGLNIPVLQSEMDEPI